MGLIYLATPYSHQDHAIRERRFHRVNVVAARLISEGLHVFSPISHTHPIADVGDLPKGWDFWESYDREILAACSKMIVLCQEGWNTSVGVQAEISIAKEMGIPVEFIDE